MDMDILLFCQLFDSHCWTILNLALALFATAIAVGYLLKPRLKFRAYVNHKRNTEDYKWYVEVLNKNCFLTVKEIKCEMAVSKSVNFKYSNTLDLIKGKTLVLKRSKKIKEFEYPRNYIFKPELTIKEICESSDQKAKKDYKFLRIRLLAPNFLGVKKHYERIYKIDCINNIDCSDLMYNCQHRKQTKKMIIKELSSAV